jgi:type IV pilus assembly protein PilA
MLSKLRRRAEEEKGFTLIELLVVILIIGILAAIAIPAFLNQKGKAYDSNAKSDARTAATAEETYYTDNSAYSGTVTDLTTIETTLNSAVGAANENLLVAAPSTVVYGATLAGGETANNSYQVTDTSKSGIKYAIVRRSDGTTQRTCNVPAGTNPAGCKLPAAATSGNGTW